MKSVKFGLIVMLLALNTPALGITIEPDYSHFNYADVGNNDTIVRNVISAAEDKWEALIPTAYTNQANLTTFNIMYITHCPTCGGTPIERPPYEDDVATAGLNDNYVHEPNGGTVNGTIDIYGQYKNKMFWDPSPSDNSEFSIAPNTPAGAGVYIANSQYKDKYDMLTVMMHELGHILGFTPQYAKYANKVPLWNNTHSPNDDIDYSSGHFDFGNLTNSVKLMAPGAGCITGCRVFPQSLDKDFLSSTYGYAYTIPEPSSVLLMIFLIPWLFSLHNRRSIRKSVSVDTLCGSPAVTER